MNVLRAVWRAQIISLRNVSRYDTRMRVAGVILLLFNFGVGSWSISQLFTRLQQWQALGEATLTTNLWLLCINVWLGMSFFTMIGMLNALGRDETLLLFTLPISSAIRFRIFYSTFFVQNLWNWLLLEVGCVGYVLIATLGIQGLLWLLLLQCGVAVTVGGVLVLALLFIRYVLFPDKMRTRIAILTLCTATGLVLVLHFLTQDWQRTALLHPLSLAMPQPVWVLLLLLSALFLLLGPLASYPGNLYIVAFQHVQSGGSTRNAFTFPGVRLISSIVARRSSLISALLFKALFSQSRNWIFWLRLALVIVLLALFPIVHTFLSRYGFSDTLQVIAYASGVALWHVLEVAPAALSGETNRLTLYLTAPFEFSQIIRAKLMLFLFPIVIEGLLITLLLSWLVRLPLNSLGFALVAVLCMITATVMLPVLGSVWDEDLEATVEGSMQAILQEEAPVSPKRIGLLNLSVLLFTGMFLVLWQLPPFFALLSLTGVVVVVFVSMWYFGVSNLHKLVLQK